MRHSDKCKDLTTFWVPRINKCEPCEKPGVGRGITPNCGMADDGHIHEVKHKKCKDGTFNDGTHYFCKPCSCCPEGVEKQCIKAADTVCISKQQVTIASAKKTSILSFHETTTASAGAGTPTHATHQKTTPSTFYKTNTASEKTNPDINKLPPESWALPLTFIICTTFLLLSFLFIARKRGYRKTHCPEAQFTPLPPVPEISELKDIFSPDILAAPLKCVLDNLDVLDELIVLLDPETPGIKNTKHLASLCGFSSSQVAYTYSLKESRSPLKALLEGVTCGHPEWTVLKLAELLRQMERMDAVMALSKICQNKLDIIDV